MEIFLSKPKIVKATLLGALLTFASLFISAKVIFEAANESVLADNWTELIFSRILFAIGVLGFLIFGAMTAVFISRLFDEKPQVILSVQGIEDKRLGCGMIEWDEIAFVTFMETKYAQWLSLVLKSPEKFYPKLSAFQIFLRKMNGQKGDNSFRIRFNDLNVSIENAWQFIEENVIKKREEKDMSLMS